jgi:hypothetical protein
MKSLIIPEKIIITATATTTATIITGISSTMPTAVMTQAKRGKKSGVLIRIKTDL